MIPEVFAGIDVGSENVTCVIAEVTEDGLMRVTGAGRAPTGGSVREGVIVDLQGASQAVSRAVEEAESLSSWKVTEAVVSVSGCHVRGFPGRGTVNVRRENDYMAGKVTREDIEAAIETAEMVNLPRESMVIRTERCGYTVDDSDILRNPPLGLRADRLTADIYMVTADRTAVLNIQQAVHDAGMRVTALYPAASAASRSVLTVDEREMGVVLLDIGCGTTDIAVYFSGALAHLSVVPVGGETVTRALQQLRIPRNEAERLKREHVNLVAAPRVRNEEVEVATFGGRGAVSVSLETVNQMVYKSVAGIMSAVRGELKNAGLEEISVTAGMVLTGGGSGLRGIAEAASRIIGLPVEIGRPSGVDVSSPLVESAGFAVAVGLVLMAAGDEMEKERMVGENPLARFTDGIRALFRKLR